jgi:hypothetical protein
MYIYCGADCRRDDSMTCEPRIPPNPDDEDETFPQGPDYA